MRWKNALGLTARDKNGSRDMAIELCRELWPDNYAPTPAHHFVALLHEKGILRRCFTQNIDSLEAAAGLPADMVVAASMGGHFCIDAFKPSGSNPDGPCHN